MSGAEDQQESKSNKRLFQIQEISAGSYIIKVMMVPKDKSPLSLNVFSALLPAKYEKNISVYNKQGSRLDSPIAQNVPGYSEIDKLAEEKAKIISSYKNAEYTVTHTSLLTLLAVGIVTAASVLVDVYQPDSVLKNAKIIAFVIIILNLFAAYFEKSRSLRKDLSWTDLEAIANEIDSFTYENNPQPLSSRSEEKELNHIC